MTIVRRKGSGQSASLPVVLFFGAFFLYVYLRINPSVLYHCHGQLVGWPAFRRGWAFFRGFVGYPGGVVEYLSALVSQLYYFPWAGALVVSIVAWFFYLLTGWAVRALSGKEAAVLGFVPALGLLAAYSRYIHCLQSGLEILAALTFFGVYVRVSRAYPRARMPVLLLLLAFVYYIGGSAYLLLALFCGLVEIRARRYMTALSCFVCAAAVAHILGSYVLDTGLTHPYIGSLVKEPVLDSRIAKAAIGSYILFACAAVAVSCWGFWATKGRAKKAAGGSGRDTGREGFLPAVFQVSRWGRFCRYLAGPLIVLAVGTMFAERGQNQTLRRVLFCAGRSAWDELLRVAPRQQASDLVCYEINRALYHTGRLPYEMFAYPQGPGALWPCPQGSGRVNLLAGDFCFEVGLFNDAQIMAHEQLETFGDYPVTLKRLALVNLVKGQPEAAKVFLSALSKDLICGRWARKYLQQIATDPLCLNDAYIQQLRALGPASGPSDSQRLFDEQMQWLLRHNRHNRMAFEYLMASYLLTKQLERVVELLPRLADFGYAQIPRHYEEALLVYADAKGLDASGIVGRDISERTRRRFERFKRILEQSWYDRSVAFNVLQREFADSYFLYFFFRELE
jgi:hypothetical protein